jgi:hypothetical protein
MSTKKRQPGKPWFTFKLFGLLWKTRIIPANSAALDKGATLAYCDYDTRTMGFSDALTNEQLRTALVHEMQHAIEDHADVDYEEVHSPEVADRLTDQVARGWLYVIRESPEIIAFLRDERPRGA